MPLTVRMVENNVYEDTDVLVKEDYDGLSGCCIFENTLSYIDIKVLEVRKDCQRQHIGESLINILKSYNKPIYVHSLDNAKNFYIKQGFYQASSNNLELMWE